MNRNSAVFIYTCGALAICGFLFFPALVVGLPFSITCLIALAVSVVFTIYINRKIHFISGASNRFFLQELGMIAGFATIGYRCLPLSEKWGDWDAWSIWNLHAKFLVSGNNWQNMFHPVLEWTHPDYPLMLPDLVAMGSKIFADNFLVIPFVISLLFTLSVAGLVYTEVASKNIIAGIAVLLAFIFNDFFIRMGVSQFADILVAFFYLATIICLHQYELSGKPVFIGLSSFFIVCALWSKNEGAICALAILLVYAKDLFNKKNIRSVLMAVLLPGSIWLLFKLCFAPANDLVQQNINWLDCITNAASYRTIIDFFYENIKMRFPELFTAWVITGLCTMILKKFINRKFIVLIVITVVYQASYLITPYGLEWHLSTSQNRLLLQVFPSFVFIGGLSFANVINMLRLRHSHKNNP